MTKTALVALGAATKHVGGSAAPACEARASREPDERDVHARSRRSDGWAVSPADFVAASGDVSVPPGDSTARISVDVVGDLRPEATEPLGIRLSEASAQLSLPPTALEYQLIYGGLPDIGGIVLIAPEYVKRALSGVPAEWTAGESRILDIALFMPCQGSNGAGERKTFSTTFTAVVA